MYTGDKVLNLASDPKEHINVGLHIGTGLLMALDTVVENLCIEILDN